MHHSIRTLASLLTGLGLVATACSGCSAVSSSSSGSTSARRAANVTSDTVEQSQADAAGLGDLESTTTVASPTELARTEAPASTSASLPSGYVPANSAPVATRPVSEPPATVGTSRGFVSNGITYWTPVPQSAAPTTTPPPGTAGAGSVTAAAERVTVTATPPGTTAGTAVAVSLSPSATVTSGDPAHPVLVGSEPPAHALAAINVYRTSHGLQPLVQAAGSCRLVRTGRAGATDRWASDMIIATLPQVVGDSRANAMTWGTAFTGVMWTGTVGMYKC